MNKVEKINPPTQIDRFIKALRTAGLTSLLAFLVGLVFVYIAKYYGLLEKEHLGIGHYLVGIILEHVGIGLVVSSIAVFAYEWLVHTEENIKLTNALNEAVTSISADTATFQQMKEAFGKEAFEKGMSQIFGVKSDGSRYHFERNICQIVNDAFELKQIQTEDSVQYLNALSWLMWHTVRDNTAELVKFAKGSRNDWVYSVPESAAQMASRVLGAQMKIMQKGDSYFSVSKVDLYEHKQMKYFFEETETAIKRGVNVYRIFNLCTLDVTTALQDNANQDQAGARVHKDLQEMMEIIEAHDALMIRSKSNSGYSGKYEVKFFTKEKIPNVIKDTSLGREEIKKATFGLFDKGAANKLICFNAIETNPPLSELKLHYCTKDSQEKVLFDSLWVNSSSANPIINDATGPAA